jgi:predicted RNase H-like HicB family nuclease
MPEDRHQPKQFTAIIEREDDGFVALCPEVDVASQGDTIEEARQNLREAVELFLETADPSEIEDRLHSETTSRSSLSPLARLRVLSGEQVCDLLQDARLALISAQADREDEGKPLPVFEDPDELEAFTLRSLGRT